ncbi:thiamine/thiamine pyrophosphate ABC transporter, permease protein [Youhaiella tibetensis]|uniref:thiamine/thiamine pyrophosphate ABC transporter permease ThiP n=1 Tax=Paradevosia tibetensis TaxID=1447062 RepID=UPI0014789E51|nr:thiamine/thiamine pyrophosphate ABC transporter permease ThiP [Youhaiella tibetensis]GGF47206.1 thiamine/thiamine pyrophosphate ABC transporter, permease protein [Youhaiella tibetensis]
MKPSLPSSEDRLILPSRPLRLFGGAATALFIAGLVVMVLWSILHAAANEPQVAQSTIDIPHLLRMTSIQAGLTTILSLVVGTALAWCLNRLTFPGRGLVVGLFAAAIVTPGLIVAFGLLSVWGRNGWINAALSPLGLSIGNPMFGLPGILFAHVILDAAFAARVLLARLDGIPTARLKTGQSLALGPVQRFAMIDWPAIRGALPGLAAIIFLIAFTSFPIVLLLGGGPANQTLEVAIYSAVRLDFDLRGAVNLALVQIGVCSAIILLASALAPVPTSLGPSGGQSWADRPAARAFQWLILLVCLLAFVLPLLSVLIDGLAPGLRGILAVTGRDSFKAAIVTSLVIGLASATLCVLFALLLAMARATTARHLARIGLGAPAYAYLAVPAVVLALGFFLLVRNMGIRADTAAPYVVVIANALLSLPFAIATLGPPLEAIARGQGRLVRALGLTGWQQFALVEFPLLGRDLGVAFALAFCFSLGDLGVISLFGTQDFATLPLLMYRALGTYRSNDAAVIAALMLILALLAFIGLPRLFEKLANAQA